MSGKQRMSCRPINSPRRRFAGRPSLLRKEGIGNNFQRKSENPSLPLAVERDVERSDDRVSQLYERPGLCRLEIASYQMTLLELRKD